MNRPGHVSRLQIFELSRDLYKRQFSANLLTIPTVSHLKCHANADAGSVRWFGNVGETPLNVTMLVDIMSYIESREMTTFGALVRCRYARSGENILNSPSRGNLVHVWAHRQPVQACAENGPGDAVEENNFLQSLFGPNRSARGRFPADVSS